MSRMSGKKRTINDFKPSNNIKITFDSGEFYQGIYLGTEHYDSKAPKGKQVLKGHVVLILVGIEETLKIVTLDQLQESVNNKHKQKGIGYTLSKANFGKEKTYALKLWYKYYLDGQSLEASKINIQK